MEYTWSIAIYTGVNPLEIKSPEHINNPVLTKADVTDVAAKFVADPFMIRREEGWFMFFEILNRETGRGEIGLARSSDGFNWNYERIVLREPFHLSYPHVFRHEGNFYIIPESREDQSVRLYRAINFPWEWRLEHTLLKGDFADATIFRHNGLWWLYVLEGMENLRLFHAPALQSQWLEHIKSPLIVSNLKISRPGGRILVMGEKIFRFAQDGVPLYGNCLHAMEVTQIDKAGYEESEVNESPILKANRRGWNAVGMHHADIHQLPGSGWIACVDGATVKFPSPVKKT
jgi:hypothetical protein